MKLSVQKQGIQFTVKYIILKYIISISYNMTFLSSYCYYYYIILSYFYHNPILFIKSKEN